MRISKIELEGVLSHENTSVDLPERGLVLVTGRNGSGKTTLIEGVALCLWGTTLRKKNPGWSGDRGRVLVHANGHEIERVKTRSKVMTTFGESSFTRVRDATEHADQLFGSFDIWRRVHVFSSREVSRFTTATDAFRKRMLEELLGLDRFETASIACRKDKKAIAKEHQQASQALAQVKTQLEGAEARLKDAAQTVDEDDPQDVSILEAQRRKLSQSLKHLDDNLRVIAKSRKESDRAVWEAEQEARHAKTHAERVAEGTCSFCGQKITTAMRRKAAEKIKELLHTVDLRKQELQEHHAETADHYEKLKQRKHKLGQKDHALHTQIATAQHAHARRKTHEERRKKIAESVIDFTELVDERAEVESKVRKDFDTTQVVDRVLSTQGVRAHLLTSALSAIEGVANSWLGRVAAIDETELVLKLSSYAERGDGSLKDAIGLEIEGAGNGHGYDAASAGEQRRIDVALMLALAEMAEAAHGVESGTLFFDEVFDALDEEGVEAVRDVIASLAKDRCVLLITHNDQMQIRLKGLLTEHWRVKDGEISYV